MKVVLIIIMFNLSLSVGYCQNDTNSLEGKWTLILCTNLGDTTFKLGEPEYCINNISSPYDLDSSDLKSAIKESYETSKSITLNFENQTYFHTTRYFTEDLIENKNRFELLNGQLKFYQNETESKLFSIRFIIESDEIELIRSEGNLSRWTKQ